MKTKPFRFLLLVSLLLGMLLVGCEKEDDRTINQVYVVLLSYMDTDNHNTDIYKIDLLNKEFSISEVNLSDGGITSAKDAEYTLVSILGDDEIAKFRKSAKKYSFAKWEEHYANPSIADGGGWQIMIVFSNGDTLNTSGSNAFPDTWDNMKEAFKVLLGQDILWSSY